MTAPRCEPPPEHRGVRWHGIVLGSKPPIIAEWDDDDLPGIPWWCQEDWQSVEDMTKAGYRYLAPAIPPEVKG